MGRIVAQLKLANFSEPDKSLTVSPSYGAA